MTMEAVLEILAVGALIGIIIYYILETKTQKQEKSKNENQKNISKNVRFMIYGNQDSPNIALGKDNYVYIVSSSKEDEVTKISLYDITNVEIHYHIRADKDKNVISPQLKLDNHTFIDQLDLKVSTELKNYYLSYTPYMKHVESNEVRSKIIQMKRLKLMIEKEKDKLEYGVVNK